MLMVYIASPYTLGDVGANVRLQMEAADILMDEDICPIVPLYTHFQHIYFPRKYEDWMKMGFEKIRRCDALLRLSGESKGADKEVQYAQEIGVPVYFNLSTLLSDLPQERFNISKEAVDA